MSSRLCDPCLLIVLEGCSTGAEYWLEHPDYSGYQISSFGHVRHPKGRVLAGSLDEGYIRVSMPDRQRIAAVSDRLANTNHRGRRFEQ